MRKHAIYTWVIFFLVLLSASIFASDDVRTIGDVAGNFDDTFPVMGKVTIALSYLAGIGFGICAVYKFKQYKDNPTQIPVGTPFVLLTVSVCMVFLPAVIAPAGNSFFGAGNADAGWFEGSALSGSGLPGSD